MALAKLTETGEVHVTRSWARPQVYEFWLSLLAPADYQVIVAAMDEAIDNRDVVRAQYLACRPGNGEEWFEVYEPVYEAMGRNHDMAGKFIGLILWEVMSNRDEQWYFHKIDKTIANEYNLLEEISYGVLSVSNAPGCAASAKLYPEESRKFQVVGRKIPQFYACSYNGGAADSEWTATT